MALVVVVAVPTSSTDADAGPPPVAVESAAEEPTTASVRLRIGSDERLVETRAATVGLLLIEQGIAVEPGDIVYPARATAIQQGLVVILRLTRDVIVHEDEPIPYGSQYRYDYTIPLGQKVVVQAGANGALRRSYEVRTVNDEETIRTFIGEETVAPTNEIALGGLGDVLHRRQRRRHRDADRDGRLQGRRRDRSGRHTARLANVRAGLRLRRGD